MGKVKKSNRETKSKSKPIYIGDPNVFAVDCVLSRRNRGRKTEYLVKWSGYPVSENSWVDKSDITPDLVSLFNLGQAETLTVETGSVQEANITNCVESFFEEDLHTLGANVELLSATVDFRLFSTPDGTHTNQESFQPVSSAYSLVVQK